MREIKFRAWDGDVVQLWQWEQVQKIDGWWKHKGLNLMQYTGLKDKNGKEIYEGDIVVWHDDSENRDRGWSRTAIVKINPDLCFHCFKIGKRPADINFHYGNFIWKETNKYFEIIGNIYENPELLK